MRRFLKILIYLLIIIHLIYLISFFFIDLGRIIILSFSLLVFDFLSFYFLNNLMRMGNNSLDIIVKLQNELNKNYGSKIRFEVFNAFYFTGNASLFKFFLLELFHSSIKRDLRTKQKFMRKEKGWLNTFKSTEKALMRYDQLYKQLFENQLKFQISFLITLLSINMEYYAKMQKILEKSESVLIRNDMPKEIIKMILEKSKEGFDYDSFIKSHPLLAINNYRNKLPLDANLINFKRKFINYLIRLRAYSEREKSLKKFVNWILYKINQRSYNVIPPEIIKTFQEMELSEFRETYYYKIFFKSILEISLKEKLEYLKAIGLDFDDWIVKELRNKFVHELNIIYVETKNGLCGAKLISGTEKNRIFTIKEYFESLCKLKALTNYLYNHLFRIEQNKAFNYTIYQVSNIKLMKALRKNKYNFPK